MSDTGKAVPLARAPHDHMRQGFSSFAQDAAEGHPLERLSRNRIRDEFAFKMDTAERIYGSAFVMRMKTEVATLSQVQCAPYPWSGPDTPPSPFEQNTLQQQQHPDECVV